MSTDLTASAEGEATRAEVEPRLQSVEIAKTPISDDLTLDRNAIDAIMAKNQTKLVVLIGGSRAGKTSLLAVLFHKFLKGAVESVAFAGSESLPAFARMLAAISVQNRISRASMPRTTPSGDYFGVHLKLAHKNRLTDYIFIDISGEMYRDAGRHASFIPPLKFIRRADFVGLVLDGSKICNPAKRESEFQQLFAVTKRLVDTNTLQPSAEAAIVFTKIDTWDDDSVEPMAAHYSDKLVVSFPWRHIRRIDTAALPRNKEIDDTGLSALLATIIEAPAFCISSKGTRVGVSGLPTSWYARFGTE